MGKPKKPSAEDKTKARRRMYEYWDDVFRKDCESKTARSLLKNIEDPDSIFHDDEFLNSFLDEIEEERGEKNTKWVIKNGKGKDDESS